MKKLYGIILLLLAILMTLFVFFGAFWYRSLILNGRLPWGSNDDLHYHIVAVFFHAFGFAFLCLLLVVLLIISIKQLRSSRLLHESMYRMYDAVFSNLATGLIVLDSRRKVRYINPSCALMLRKELAEIGEGSDYGPLLDPVLVPIAEKLNAALDNGTGFSREYRVFLPDGIRCYKCELYTITVENLGFFYIISLEDKTIEDEIREKLSQQLEETHRYAVSKDNFFANMSHEIRTPINAILGMTYFLRNAEKDTRCLDYVRKIENASELLLGVVNDILDFSKMQEHKFSLKAENFNLSDIKKILADLFNMKAEQKGLTLSIEFDCPEEFRVYGDQFRLTQVFMNLVSNAIKFTDKGYISASLNHEIIGKEIILRCTVRDTGCGISEEDMAKLFTEFEQFGNVLLKSHEGTGLGLAISKRLVELMHGVIWVDSTPGKGSSFHFVVVLSKPEPEIAALNGTALPVIERRTGRVLLVEDNEINAEIAASLLQEIDLVAVHMGDGCAAIDHCRGLPPDYYDLILMDIHMPRMNGYDASRILKNDVKVSCPILAVTATSEDSATNEAYGDVIAGHILKPYNPAIFRALFGITSG